MSQEPANTGTFCYIHPNRETTLRCNRCERPICTQCAVLTPTGYRCKECVRGQQKTFDTAKTLDYPLAFIVSGVLSFIGVVIVDAISGFIGFFALFLAPVAASAIGVMIAEAVRRTVQKRRSKRLHQVALAGTIAGALPIVIFSLIPLLFGGGFGSLYGLIIPALYTFLVASATYYRLSGIQIR